MGDAGETKRSREADGNEDSPDKKHKPAREEMHRQLQGTVEQFLEDVRAIVSGEENP